MNKSLTDKDIKYAIGNCIILKYSDLSKFLHINELFIKKFVIILFETKFNYGHWCLLFKNTRNSIEFFDSYGLMPDSQLKYISSVFRKHNNMIYPHLTYLLLFCSNKIEYNNHIFQKSKNNIATCGRWVILRCLFYNYNIDEFYEIIKSKKKKNKTLDHLAVFLTNNL